MKSVVIIGGGLGGLFTGAILAKEGLHVTVVEKNPNLGGGLQSFQRFGETFDTGMHVLAGMQADGSIRKLCEYLGIMGEVQMRAVDEDCTNALYCAADGQRYCLPQGRRNFVEALTGYFPEEACGIRAYVDAVFEMIEALDMFNLRPIKLTDFFSMDFPDEYLSSAETFIERFVRDPRLKSVLAYINSYYGSVLGRTPAYIHAVLTGLHINGLQRFVGSSQRFAELLGRLIERNGGRLILGDGVQRIELEGRHIAYIETRTGLLLSGDYYVSAIHPCSMLPLLSERPFTKIYVSRLNSLPSTCSAFILNIKMKPEVFPYINHSEHYMSRYGDVWNLEKPAGSWPVGFLLMTPVKENQGEWASTVQIIAPMLFDEVRKWENTTSGKRGGDYLTWKEQKARTILDCVEKMYPGFSEKIAGIDTSSPLTIRDYYGVKEGSMYGYAKDCNNMTISNIPVVTKVDNLLLTGQNINSHGFYGTPLTAVNTCEAILGLNYVKNKIGS